MEKSSHAPILVTGSHRSGSTWAGNMIALSSQVRYVNEPFHLQFRNSPFQYWFEYVSVENEKKYLPYLKNEIALSHYCYWDLLNIRIRQDIKPRLRKILYQVQGRRPLFKDPLAILSAEWLAERFGMEVLVLIRHPAAFVSSIKILNWEHDFSQFLKQPLLMNEVLKPFEEQIKTFAENPPDIIDQAILLWNIFHSRIYDYSLSNPEWLFFRYEDIAVKPVDEFRKIYKSFSLDFTPNIAAKISEFSSTENKIRTTSAADPNTIMRDSKSELTNWKSRLSFQEIDRIYTGTNKISSLFYSENDWK